MRILLLRGSVSSTFIVYPNYVIGLDGVVTSLGLGQVLNFQSRAELVGGGQDDQEGEEERCDAAHGSLSNDDQQGQCSLV